MRFVPMRDKQNTTIFTDLLGSGTCQIAYKTLHILEDFTVSIAIFQMII